MKKKPLKKTTRSTGAAATGAGASSPMNVDLLQQIIELMDQTGLTTVDVRDGDKRIILRRGGEAVEMPAPGSHFVTSHAAVTAPAPSPAPIAPAEKTDSDAGLVPIKSPMVGTFYTAASPDAKAFVSVGSSVDDDTDVCIIEAMKVFNNIKAETRGTIAKVLVTNGQTVEFGQTLFLVKP